MSAKPANANETCVGPSSETAGKADSCAGCPNQNACASGAGRGDAAAALAPVVDRLASVKHTILVLSGKGGVGKSTFSCQLAFALAAQGKNVGLLDIDICGPSVPRMLGLTGQQVHQSASGWSPVYVADNLGVMSIGFMLPSTDDAVIWRGPRKSGLIKSFLTEVHWGELDYLIIDTPPGTSDEHISIVQYLRAIEVDGALVVTTPQEVSMADVRKELSFCAKSGLKVLGLVENMAGLRVPMRNLRFTDPSGADRSDEITKKLEAAAPEVLSMLASVNVFQSQSGATARQMAADFDVRYLGAVPLDPSMGESCEKGESFLQANPESPAAPAFQAVVDQVVQLTPDEPGA